MVENLTGAEKVLYKAEYQFNINTLKLTEAEAQKKALDKIARVRKLSKKVSKW